MTIVQRFASRALAWFRPTVIFGLAAVGTLFVWLFSPHDLAESLVCVSVVIGGIVFVLVLLVNPERGSWLMILTGVLWLVGMITHTLEASFWPRSTGWLGYSMVLAAVLMMPFFAKKYTGVKARGSLETLLAFESLTIGAVWTLAIWRSTFLGGTGVQLWHAGWPSLIFLFSLASALGALTITLFTKPTVTLLWIFNGYVGLAMSEGASGPAKVGVMTPELQFFVEPTAAMGWLCLACGMYTLTHQEAFELTFKVDDRIRTIVSAGSCLIAFVVIVVFTINRATFDATTSILALLFMLVFGFREYYRAQLYERLAKGSTEAAYTDTLLGVGNRWALSRDLSKELVEGQYFAVIVFNIGGFQTINEYAGHEAGDAVLRRVAAVLAKPTGRGLLKPYRLGGDEFAMVAEMSRDDALALANDLRDRLQRSVQEAQPSWVGRVQCGVASGMATQPEDRRFETVTDALEALQQVRKQDNMDLCEYTPELHAAVRRKLLIEERLRGALRTGEVSFSYQPVFELATGRMIGSEALVRWQDQTLGDVTPDELLPLAVATGATAELTDLSLVSAMTLVAHANESDPDFFVSINLTASQLMEVGFIDRLVALANEKQVRRRNVRLEISESDLAHACSEVLGMAQRLVSAGFHICLDQFGGGYSSIAELGKAEIHTIKLDRRLTQQSWDPMIQSIVVSLVQDSRELGVDVVPVGVDSTELFEHLRASGVTHGQGNFLSGAVPASTILRNVGRPAVAAVRPQ